MFIFKYVYIKYVYIYTVDPINVVQEKKEVYKLTKELNIQFPRAGP